MKVITFIAAVVGIAPLHGQQRFQQEALLLEGPSEISRVWIGDSSDTEFLFYETEQGVDSKTMRISKPDSIFLMEPDAYTEAVEAFQGEDYEAALEQFGKIRDQYLKLRELPGNHSSSAAYHRLESLRNLGRLDDLMKELESFAPSDRETLRRPHQLVQLELYALWDAIREKSWARVQTIAEDWMGRDLPGYQRAQVAYGLGLALESQNKPLEAIDAYNSAMVADTGTSERLTSESALNALRLYLENDEVKLAMKLHDTADEDPNSFGAQLLGEAGALATLYELTLGGGKSLPEELKVLLKHAPAPSASQASAPGEGDE